MSAGPGSKIRALSTPVFSPFRGFSGRGRAVALFARGPQVWLRYGSVFRASDRGVRCAVSRCAKPVGCLPRPIVSAVFSAGVRGIGCVSFAAQGVCPVFSCCLPSLPGVFLPFAESAPCFLPFEESAVYVGDKFGP